MPPELSSAEQAYAKITENFGLSVTGVISEIGNFKPEKKEGENQQDFHWLFVNSGKGGSVKVSFPPEDSRKYVEGQMLISVPVKAKTNKAGIQKLSFV